MAGIKVRRTLDDRGFKKYMAFCESLKDGSNDALIDTFKYRFAVMEGRIVPKGAKKSKPLTEASGLGMGDFEKAFQGLVGAFLPHLDKEEQDFLGCVCNALDEKINGGDMDGAMDALKGAVRDAGGDPDAYGDDEDDEDGESVEDEGGCPEGECEVDGECVPCEDAKEPNSDEADEECCCGKKAKKMTESRKFPENPYTHTGNPKELDFGRELDGTGMLGDTESELDDYDDDAGGDIPMNQGFHYDQGQDIDRVRHGSLNVERIYDFRTASTFDQYFDGKLGVCNSEELWNEMNHRGYIYMVYGDDFGDRQPGSYNYATSLFYVLAMPGYKYEVRTRNGKPFPPSKLDEILGGELRELCEPRDIDFDTYMRQGGHMQLPLTSSANRIPGKRRGRNLTEGSGYLYDDDDYGELSFDDDNEFNEDAEVFDEDRDIPYDDSPEAKSSYENSHWAGNCTVELIPDFDVAQEFVRYFEGVKPWVILTDEHMWDTYSKNGTKNVYFCYKPNFDNMEPGDSGYNESLIAVISGPNGPETVASRVNGPIKVSSLQRIIGGDPEKFLAGPESLVDSANGSGKDSLVEAGGLGEGPVDDYPTDVDLDSTSADGSNGDLGTPTVDYDAMADELLRDAGYDTMTIGNGGVSGGNRKFYGR